VISGLGLCHREVRPRLDFSLDFAIQRSQCEAFSGGVFTFCLDTIWLTKFVAFV